MIPMQDHNYEMWTEDGSKKWGWSCWDCGAEDEGFDGLNQAEAAADAFHRQVSL